MSSGKQEAGSISAEPIDSRSADSHVFLTDLFKDHVRTQGDCVSLIQGSTQITYSELYNIVCEISDSLTAAGLKEGDRVGVWSDRSINNMACLLAILMLNATIVPLDPDLPTDRLEYIVRDSSISMLLGTGRSFHDFRRHIFPITSNVGNNKLNIATPHTKPHIDVLTNNTAYILYTSGSTGTPKGVCMPVAGLSNLIEWQITSRCDQGIGTITVQLSALNFDVSFQEIFSTLCSGGSLVLTPSEAQKDMELLLETIIAYDVNRIFMPFVSLQLLATASQELKMVPSSLVEVITAGEQLRITKQIIWLFKSVPTARLFNQYGPTETHVVTEYKMPDKIGGWEVLPPIGKSAASSYLLVQDENGNTSNTGEGELLIGGPGLASGYLNNRDLTDKNFVLVDHNGTTYRMYKSGDKVRVRPDGNYEYLGRLDSQVKIRGFRFEPAELEVTLSSHQSVDDSVVVVDCKGSSSDARIIAYVKPKNPDIPKSQLWNYLKTKLPAYAIPTKITYIETFPTTPSGKVNRLKLLETSRVERRETHIGSDTLTQVVSKWDSLLEHDDFTHDDDFFDVGGNSLLAVRLISQIRNSIGININLKQFLREPTVAGIMKFVVNETSNQPDDEEALV